jgi:hypothetical protein
VGETSLPARIGPLAGPFCAGPAWPRQKRFSHRFGGAKHNRFA